MPKKSKKSRKPSSLIGSTDLENSMMLHSTYLRFSLGTILLPETFLYSILKIANG